jgi:hypothetical protein
MNKLSIYLPLSTRVHIRAVTNAYYLQRVTLTPEGGAPIVFQGQGESDAPIGDQWLQTPATSSSPKGFRMDVQVDNSTDGGWTWVPSQVGAGSCGVLYYNLIMVVSEDNVDQDWNDGVVCFTWWVQPTARAAQRSLTPEAAKTAKPM